MLFYPLSNHLSTQSTQQAVKKELTSPPIFVRQDANVSSITEAQTNNAVKINVELVDSYCKLVKKFRSRNIGFYT